MKNWLITVIWQYLLPVVEFADKQIGQVKVATVEQQIDEAQHGRWTDHIACQTAEPNHRLDDAHGDQIKTWQGGDHRVPLQNDQHYFKKKLIIL